MADNDTDDALPAGFLVATPSDPAANSYCTIERMDELMKGVSAKIAERWNALEAEDEARILLEGSRLIDQFKLWGPPKVKTQGLAFPRVIDAAATVPAGVERALLEYAKHVVDGKMLGVKALQKEGVTSQSILSQSATFDREMSELPAGSRRELLKIARSNWTSGRANRDVVGPPEDGSLFG
jgi:hypothetical protein